MIAERFSNGALLKHEKKQEIIIKVMEVIKKELPEEAQTVEIIQCIFEDCKEWLISSKVEL